MAYRKAFKDPSHEDALRRNGFVILRLFSDDDVAMLRRIFDQVADAHNQGFMASVLHDDLRMRSEIHKALSPLYAQRLLPMFEDFRIVVGSMASKEANCEDSIVGLHQDVTIVDERQPGNLAITIWSPLQDVSRANGGLDAVPGSHRLNSSWRPPMGFPYPDLQALIEAEYLQELRMHPGEVLLMDGRTFHGSCPNHSNAPRAVAAGVAAPAESALVYVHHDPEETSDDVEIWQVPENFYRTHMIGQRPQDARFLAKVSGTPDPLTESIIRQTLTPTLETA